VLRLPPVVGYSSGQDGTRWWFQKVLLDGAVGATPFTLVFERPAELMLTVSPASR
jgi:hypothetical protein